MSQNSNFLWWINVFDFIGTICTNGFVSFYIFSYIDFQIVTDYGALMSYNDVSDIVGVKIVYKIGDKIWKLTLAYLPVKQSVFPFVQPNRLVSP